MGACWIYRLDAVEVDTLAGCVRRSGVEERLRQKSFQVLVFLIENRGRLVTKDELMGALWPGVVVTEDALVQSIVDVRRLLGDDARSPRYVKTVPKQGYRFVGPVEEVPAGVPASGVSFEEVTSLSVCVEEERSVRPTPAPTRPWLVRAVAVLAFAALVVGALALGPRVLGSRRAFEAGAPAARAAVGTVKPDGPGDGAAGAGATGIAVLAFENRSGVAELDWLRQGLADMLITELSRRPGLSVLSRDQVHELGRARAAWVVTGTFTSVGGSLRVDAQVLDAASGRLAGAEALTVSRPEAILTSVAPLARRLSTRLDSPEKTAPSSLPLEEAMTGSLPAYRAYSLALERAEAHRTAEALELLESAIALDPTFAMAHARIGYVYVVSWGHSAKARPYLEKAWALSAGLTERNRLSIAAWYAMANGEFPEAIRTYRKLLAAAPDDVESLVRLGVLLRGEDKAEEAVEVLQQALAYSPDSTDACNKLSGAFMELGRHEEAIAMATRYVELAPEEPNARDTLGMALAWAGRYPDALDAYGKALDLKSDFEIARVHKGNVLLALGRNRDALAEFGAYLAAAPSPAEASRAHASLSIVYRRMGDSARARDEARRALEVMPENTLEAFRLAVDDRSWPLVERLRESVLRQPDDYCDRGGRVSVRRIGVARGHLALAQGRPEEALAAFREALRHRPPIYHAEPYEDCLATALLSLGRHREAAGELRRILTLNPNDALSRYRLGVSLLALGDRDGARRELRTFLTLWKDADRDAPELADARRRLGA